MDKIDEILRKRRILKKKKQFINWCAEPEEVKIVCGNRKI